ncbi:MAG: Holliday junction branch migration DNA helicase RuvB [Deltaproteobacteria bacterium]|nr:MAG: Holliday junction branch migration DNA helicase RuvB [Deltaproteobacteria bacterium]
MKKEGFKFYQSGKEDINAASPEENFYDTLKEAVDLRPGSLAEYIGQENAVKTLKIAILASQKRKEPIEHILLHGPPGLGKTTLAYIIANELNVNLVMTSGPSLEKGGDLVGILTNLNHGDILFIDEIHRLPKIVEELLYSAMEDFAIDFVFDKGVHARTHRFRLKRFTLIGATTRAGLLSAPLRDRFGLFKALEFYSIEELMVIIKRSALILDESISDDAGRILALRSRGTPRIANRLLRRVRDYAIVKGSGTLDAESVEEALQLEGIDENGLTILDRKYLNTIIEFYNGGPAGIEAIAAALQEESDTLVDLVEPFLLKEGFILRTSMGRKAAGKAYEHLGLKRIKND